MDIHQQFFVRHPVQPPIHVFPVMVKGKTPVITEKIVPGFFIIAEPLHPVHKRVSDGLGLGIISRRGREITDTVRNGRPQRKCVIRNIELQRFIGPFQFNPIIGKRHSDIVKLIEHKVVTDCRLPRITGQDDQI